MHPVLSPLASLPARLLCLLILYFLICLGGVEVAWETKAHFHVHLVRATLEGSYSLLVSIESILGAPLPPITLFRPLRLFRTLLDSLRVLMR